MKSNYFLYGARSAMPIVLGYVPLGFAFGVLAVDSGLTIFEATLMSLLCITGSGQYIAASMLSLGASTLSILLTILLINLRYLLMSASLATTHMRNWRTGLLGLISFWITDETYAVSIMKLKNEELKPAFFFGLDLPSHGSWVFSSFLGAAVGNLISNPEALGLNFALTAMFISLLMILVTERLMVMVATLAGFVSILLAAGLHMKGNIIIAAVLAATLGVMLEKWITKKSSL